MLKRRVFVTVCALLGAIVPAMASTTVTTQSGFVTVKGRHFQLDGKPYYFAGANLWYGMYLGSPGKTGDRARLINELDTLAGTGHHEPAGARHLRAQHAQARGDAGGTAGARPYRREPRGRASISCSTKWPGAT